MQQILDDQHNDSIKLHKHLQTKIDEVKKSLDTKLDDLEDKYVYSPEDLSTIRSNIEQLFDEQAHLERVSDRTSTQLDSYVQLTSDKLEELMKNFSDMEKASTSQTDVRHLQNEVRGFLQLQDELKTRLRVVSIPRKYFKK